MFISTTLEKMFSWNQTVFILKLCRSKWHRCTIPTNASWYRYVFLRQNKYFNYFNSATQVFHATELSSDVMPHSKQASMQKVKQI